MEIKFELGKQAALARAVGMKEQLMCDILKGRKKCPPFWAMRLALLSEKITGVKTTTDDWLQIKMPHNRTKEDLNNGIE